MKDLVSASGLPRTAIHHYQREGLLPPGRKTAMNAAVYGPEHIERLRLIQALRGPEMGPFGLEDVRAILASVDGGMEPGLAASLRALPGVAPVPGGAPKILDLSELAHEAGLGLSAARELTRLGLIVGRPGDGGRVFDEADAFASALLADLLSDGTVEPADLEPIAELIRETARYEAALATLATTDRPEPAGAERRFRMHRAFHALHTYLLSRAAEDAASA